LTTAIRHAEHLKSMMKPNTNLPEWVQSKITLATDYLQTAHDYIMSEMSEEVEQIDEISDELANKVKDKRTEQGRNWRQNPKWAAKSSKNFALNLARTARKEKNKVDSPEVSKIKKSANAEYEYNRSRGYSNESVEVNEAEKMKGEDPCWKNYQMVGTKKKNGKEVPNCVPVSESRKANIVREAYLKAKSKKKNEENDKDVYGKVQKFEADPVLSDTLQKQ
jgi:hypothetical protein